MATAYQHASTGPRWSTTNTVSVTVPSITDPDIAKVDVDISSAGLDFTGTIGDAVICVPLVALPTNCRLQGAQFTAASTVQVTFGSEGGNVVGAAKNCVFLCADLTVS